MLHAISRKQPIYMTDTERFTLAVCNCVDVCVYVCVCGLCVCVCVCFSLIAVKSQIARLHVHRVVNIVNFLVSIGDTVNGLLTWKFGAIPSLIATVVGGATDERMVISPPQCYD